MPAQGTLETIVETYRPPETGPEWVAHLKIQRAELQRQLESALDAPEFRKVPMGSASSAAAAEVESLRRALAECDHKLEVLSTKDGPSK